MMFKNPCGKTALTMLSLCAVPEIVAGMKFEDFVVSIRKEFQGRAPKVQKLLVEQVIKGRVINRDFPYQLL